MHIILFQTNLCYVNLFFNLLEDMNAGEKTSYNYRNNHIEMISREK